jgi:arsenite methyltransferase
LMAAVRAAAVPDYGLDDPLSVRRWLGRAAWWAGIGLALWFTNHNEYPAVSARLLIVFVVIGTACAGVAWFKRWSSQVGKLQLRDRLLDQLALEGGERVLDVGCGRGLMSVGAAKRLKSGRVIGIDSWNPQALSGNSADAAKENARAEGVADRVRFEPGDPVKLVYPEGQYDAVVSFRALHLLADDNERAKAVREMLRVLKPGGRLLIFDIAETSYYAHVLRKAGARDIALGPWTFLWLLPGRTVSAGK